jgi:hypothetical protein
MASQSGRGDDFPPSSHATGGTLCIRRFLFLLISVVKLWLTVVPPVFRSLCAFPKNLHFPRMLSDTAQRFASASGCLPRSISQTRKLNDPQPTPPTLSARRAGGRAMYSWHGEPPGTRTHSGAQQPSRYRGRRGFISPAAQRAMSTWHGHPSGPLRSSVGSSDVDPLRSAATVATSRPTWIYFAGGSACHEYMARPPFWAPPIIGWFERRAPIQKRSNRRDIAAEVDLFRRRLSVP